MPDNLHKKLKESAKKLGISKEKQDAYVFGTLDKIEKQHQKKQEHTHSTKKKK
ncbi:MAG TPA: hypothetical protein VN843_01505 [Anaerolineales bacterium]|nr:hypothetical protein [Anaerolineales bacterium]